MELKWFVYIPVLINFHIELSNGDVAPIEREHSYFYYRQVSPYIAGTEFKVPESYKSPDFRLDEEPIWAKSEYFYAEENRPFRISPYFMQQERWNYRTSKERPELMGCYCTTVYKRLTPLAGCAVLTMRHILTTATSTEAVFTQHEGLRNQPVTHILGAWYDHDMPMLNSSMYMSPARIHYHPKYTRTEYQNVTHPLGVTFDLAVWTGTYRFYGNYYSSYHTLLCTRASSHWWEYGSPTPKGEIHTIVGFQYIMAWKRKPMPWFKYAVKTRDIWKTCPKTEWGWYFCIPANWAKFGIEHGAALHRMLLGKGWKFDGLVGINVLSMKLRASDLIHYFHPVDTHPVLDFLYDAYNSRIKYDYLDPRFYDTKKGPPRLRRGWIPWSYPLGNELMAGFDIPFNK